MKLSKITLLVASLFITSMPESAAAKVTMDAKARYETDAGKSKWYSIKVNLFTGSELSALTGPNFRISSLKDYAVIFWGKDQATVIEIANHLFCFGNFSESCLPLLANLRGKDQDGDEWEICTKLFCG